jgi:hypothetical protein
MINKDKQVVCDYTKMILNDGVTIIPNYLEVTPNQITTHISNDPNNLKPHAMKVGMKLKRINIGLLRNRIKGDGKSFLIKTTKKGKTGIDKKRHFKDINFMERFIVERIKK